MAMNNSTLNLVMVLDRNLKRTTGFKEDMLRNKQVLLKSKKDNFISILRGRYHVYDKAFKIYWEDVQISFVKDWIRKNIKK